ncbi:MAG TPA: ABC transporter permease [Candidatus Wallbacteria bacterium]|nr:MAG: Teichoic acid translocation permease protein TagG [bacterium ADurb.Bin243]HOD39092.1 ABC transporter permease [Candidatus Wallbacteria bacterium]HPG59336.1 ABC transporter permease [Candidatus Wallbacteria bacterium]
MKGDMGNGEIKNIKYTLHISPGKVEINYFKDLWRYRELFLFLAWRDVLVRYKQTVIGVLWSVLRPLITMIVFTIVFSKLANLNSNGAPYGIMVFAGTLPWQFFSNSLSDSGNSLIANSHLISKVYFPRVIIPASSVIVSFIDFLIAFLIMLAIMVLWYSFIPPASIVLIIPFLALAFFSSLGLGFLLSALTVKYRDFRYIVPFIVQFGLYISPVGFMSSIVPEKWRLLYSLNPIVGVIDGFRWAILGDVSQPLWWPGVAVSAVVSALLFVIGFGYFRNTEKAFADVI